MYYGKSLQQRKAGANFFNRAEHLDDQHAMVRDDGASAFADNFRVGHLLGIADVGNVIDDVVGVFLERIIGRTFERRPAADVIDAQAAADIEILNRETHLVEFGVKARSLLHCFFDGQNVGHLGANVKVQQLEAMDQVFGFEQSGGRQQFGRTQAELGIFAAAFRPAPHAFAEETRTNAQQRLHAELSGHGDDLF